MRTWDPAAEPFFSVVIPLYNKEHFVERAVRSVLAQAFGDFEVVVVDDGSTDAGPEVVSRIRDDRLRLIRRNHVGVSEARNTGIEEARASRIAFLDADDEWEESFLSVIFDLIRQYPDAGLYGTAYTVVGKRGLFKVDCGAEFRDEVHPEIVRHFFRAALPCYFPLMTSSACAPKQALREIGGFPPGAGEDQAVWARLALHHDVVISRLFAAKYYEYGVENSTRYRYYGPDGHFDFSKLLEEGSEDRQYADLEKWVEKKMYDMAMIALVHGDDQRVVNDVLRRVTSRHHLRRRYEVRALQFLPAAARIKLFWLYKKF